MAILSAGGLDASSHRALLSFVALSSNNQHDALRADSSGAPETHAEAVKRSGPWPSAIKKEFSNHESNGSWDSYRGLLYPAADVSTSLCGYLRRSATERLRHAFACKAARLRRAAKPRGVPLRPRAQHLVDTCCTHEAALIIVSTGGHVDRDGNEQHGAKNPLGNELLRPSPRIDSARAGSGLVNPAGGPQRHAWPPEPLHGGSPRGWRENA